jgi:hypothetical protein
MTAECVRILLVLLMLSIILCKAVPNSAFAESPSFVRQVVIDRPNDWFLIKSRMDESPIRTSDGNKIQIKTGKNLQDCTTMEKHRFYDISAVSYFSNGKTLNATIWLYHPLIEPPSNASEWLTPPIKDDPWYRIIYGMAIGIESAYDIQGSDYHARNVWNVYYDKNWAKIVEEMSPTINETKVSDIEDNYAGFFKREKKYIDLSLDLSSVTYPDRYSLLFYTQYIFIKDGRLCALSDISSHVSIPPPEFTISTSPNNIDLRPGEDKTIRLQIKSDTNTKSEVYFSTNQTDDIKLSLSPEKTSISPYGLATSRLHIKVSDNAQPFEYILPLSANMSIPTKSKIRGNVIDDITRNSVSANITENSNLTLTVLPPLRPDEHLNNFVNAWITPVSGMWSFLAGVAVIVGPLVIRLYAKKKQNRDKNKKLGDWFDVSK